MRRTVFLSLLWLVSLGGIGAAELQERPALGRFFEAAGTSGTIVVRDVTAEKTIVYNGDRAEKPYLPASTFKIPAALIALETGVVKDAHKDVLPWNGIEWIVSACNADQTLATAVARSCMPIFANLGKRIGDARLNSRLAAFDYGNHDASGAYPYWIEGNLRISALQQIDFLDRLRRGVLPVSPAHMETVRGILIIEKGDGYVLRGKTGWAMSPEPDVGWLVGWVERGGNAYLFALNLDIAERAQADARLSIAKAVLKDVGALP